jgi:hypothetical protein
MDLIALLQRWEGKTLEYKRDLSTTDGLLRTLVAFANTADGVLVGGVEDGTRRVIGIPDVLATEERLSNMVVDSILPRLVAGQPLPAQDLQVLESSPHALHRRRPVMAPIHKELAHHLSAAVAFLIAVHFRLL